MMERLESCVFILDQNMEFFNEIFKSTFLPNSLLFELSSWTTIKIFIACFFSFYLLRWFNAKRKFANDFDKLPGPRYFPFFGNLREMGYWNASMAANVNPSTVYNDIWQGLCGFYRKEQIFRTWIFGTPSVTIFGAETAEALLSSNALINKSSDYDNFVPWLGNGLLLSAGETWRIRRKFLIPSFHFRVLEEFFPIMNEHSLILVNKIGSMLEKDFVGAFSLVKDYTLGVICETTMGIRLNRQNSSDKSYIKALEGATYAVWYWSKHPYIFCHRLFSLTKQGKRFNECIKIINDFSSKLIKEKKEQILKSKCEELRNDTKKRNVLLDILVRKHLEDPGNFTELNIQDEINTFMFAGQDTSSASLAWVLYLLGLNTDVQEKVYNEMVNVYGDNVDNDVTLEKLRHLKYLDMVLKESQRLYPAVRAIYRAVENNITIGKYKIPRGSTIFLYIYALHRDPNVFPNPEIFDPERFSLENSAGRNPYAFVPFLAGPRNCIGQKFALMEIKILLSHIFRRFKVISLDPRDKVLVSPDIVLKPLKDIRLKFEPRLSNSFAKE